MVMGGYIDTDFYCVTDCMARTEERQVAEVHHSFEHEGLFLRRHNKSLTR